jgi:hypothetical protein
MRTSLAGEYTGEIRTTQAWPGVRSRISDSSIASSWCFRKYYGKMSASFGCRFTSSDGMGPYTAQGDLI